MNYFTRLLDLIASPIGLAIVLLAVLVFFLAVSYSFVRWVVVGVVIYVASLQKFSDQWISSGPPLAYPLEAMIRIGRPLTVVGLLFLLVLAVSISNTAQRSRGRTILVLYPFLLIHLILALKLLSQGDQVFAILSLVTVGLVFLVFTNTVGAWFRTEPDCANGALAITVAVAVLVIAAAYQAYFDTGPIAVAHNRFHGTTGNSQHAAVFLSAALPAIFFSIGRWQRSTFIWLAYLALLAAVAYLLYWTKSRTGIAMASISVLFVLAGWSNALRSMVAPVIVVLSYLMILLSLADPGALSALLPGEDTRTAVWNYQFQVFLDNPLFGENIRGGRLGFGENSWLAMAAATGLIGLVAMLFFGIAVTKMMLELWHIRLPMADRRAADMVVSGLAMLLLGSFAEAYFLGTLTAPIMLLYIYVLAGNAILDRARRSRWQRVVWPARMRSLPSQ